MQWVSHWSANAAEPLPTPRARWPPTRTLRPALSLFRLNNQSPVLSHFPPEIPGNGVSFLLEINFVVSAFVSSRMYIPACHVALQNVQCSVLVFSRE